MSKNTAQPDGFIKPETDRPIIDPENDEYGFVELAQKLAPSVLAATQTDGMVFGIEGKWGSGKTTLLNFLSAELSNASEYEDVHVISLAPWLQGTADNMAVSLLSQISKVLEKEDNPESDKSRNKKSPSEENTKLFKAYAVKVSRGAAPFLKLARHVFPGAGIAAEIAETTANYIDNWETVGTATQLKAEIVKLLNESNLRFVVLIDDLDRLEPAQTVEVIRLVRSIADFPKIAYCLCYDRSVIIHALEWGLGVQNGDVFLQKIVQLSFSIPLPEPFDLRVQLREKVLAFYKAVHGQEAFGEVKTDILNVLDCEGGLIEVPRDVTLIFNGIKFAYPPIRNDCYFPDVCWLQIVKAKRPKLYSWVERYLNTRSVLVTSSAGLGVESRREVGKELKELLPSNLELVETIDRVGKFIPGLEQYIKKFGNQNKDTGEELHVFQSVDRKQTTEMISRKRIGSPLHSRLYFAFAIPKSVMPDIEFEKLRNAAVENVSELTTKLSELGSNWRPIGGTWFSHVLDRLNSGIFEEMEIEELKGWAVAISDSMDRVIEGDDINLSSMLDTATQTQFQMQRLLKLIREKDDDAAHDLVIRIFSKSPSINWLVGSLFRQELQDHGIIGDRKRVDDIALTDAEVIEVKKILKSRLKEQTVRAYIELLPRHGPFLYGWHDVAGIRSPKAWVKEFVKEDANFLKLLDGMKTWAMSDKVYYPLRKNTVEPFLDWESVKLRVERLTSHDDDSIASQAKNIQEAISLGESGHW